MNKINLRETTASEFEAEVAACHGETLADINRRGPAKRLISATPRRIPV
jgi:hypothetical protein